MSTDEPGRRRGRPRKPLHGDGPLVDLARALREVVDQTDLTDNQFALHRHLSAAAVSRALNGKTTPTWDITWTIASAEPDADTARWKQRWTDATAPGPAAESTEPEDLKPQHTEPQHTEPQHTEPQHTETTGADDRQQDPDLADPALRSWDERGAGPAGQQQLGQTRPHQDPAGRDVPAPARSDPGTDRRDRVRRGLVIPLTAIGTSLAVAGIFNFITIVASGVRHAAPAPATAAVFTIVGAGLVATADAIGPARPKDDRDQRPAWVLAAVAFTLALTGAFALVKNNTAAASYAGPPAPTATPTTTAPAATRSSAPTSITPGRPSPQRPSVLQPPDIPVFILRR